MNKTLRVQICERLGGIDSHLETKLPWQRRSFILQEFPKVSTRNEFRDYIEARLVLAQAHKLYDVGMPQ